MQYDVPFIKIASACLTNKKLLRAINDTKMPVVMSTGMSTFDEIEQAINILESCDVSLLYCKSGYPTPNNEINLNGMVSLMEKYPCMKIGYSGHEIDIMPTMLAYTLGANILERHITLDRNMWGTDQSISLNPDLLQTLMDELNQIDSILGCHDINVQSCEIPAINKMRN